MRRLVISVAVIMVLLIFGSPYAQDVEYVNSTLWSEINDVSVVDNYAYCVFNNGLGIIDVSDPSSPSLINQLYFQSYGRYIDVAGNYAYLLTKGQSQITCSLYIIDISDPIHPLLAGNYEFQGTNPRDVYTLGTYAYLTWENNLSNMGGIEIVNVSDPINPTLAGRYTFDTDEFPSNVFVIENLAYVISNNSSAGTNGFEIIDVGNPSNPTFAGRYNTFAASWDVFVESNYAYMTTGYDRSLQIIDITVPSNPIFLSSCETPEPSGCISLYGNFAFVTMHHWYVYSGFCLIDMSDPENTVLDGCYDIPWYGLLPQVSISSDYAYLANYYSFYAIDISSPSNPEFVGSYAQDFAYKVYVSDNFAYTTFFFDSFRIVDITDPHNPIPTGSYESTTFLADIYVSGNYLNPSMIGTIMIPYHISIVINYIYVTGVFRHNGIANIYWISWI